MSAMSDAIGQRWGEARKAYLDANPGKGDADFLATSTGQGIKNEMRDYFAGLNDTNEIENQLTNVRPLMQSAVFGDAGVEYTNALLNRKAQLANAAPPPPPPVAISPPAMPTTPGGPPTTITSATQLPTPEIYAPQNASVADHLNGLLAQDNPYMQSAATRGLQYANQRGLMNSSMGAEASQKAAIDAALPIASQDASQAFQHNLSGQNYRQEDVLQGKRLFSSEMMGREQMRSTEGIAAADRAGAMDRQRAADAAAFDRQRAGDAAAMDRTKFEGENRLQVTRLGEEGADRRNRQTIDANKINTDNTNRANTQQSVITATAQANATYTNAMTALNNNTDIPLAERNTLGNHYGTMYDSQMKLIESISGQDLNWDSPIATSPPPPPP